MVDEASEKRNLLKSARALIALVGLAVVLVLIFVVPFGRCLHCHGYGRQIEACTVCGGAGAKKEVGFFSGPKSVPCTACNGTGKVVSTVPCNVCSGSGKSTVWARCH